MLAALRASAPPRRLGVGGPRLAPPLPPQQQQQQQRLLRRALATTMATRRDDANPQQQQQQQQQLRRCRVAVVGAGAAGLAAARELRDEGHEPVVFEQSREEGGVWTYTDATDADPLGSRDPSRRVHQSMYAGLRTNLPRELMSFGGLPFTPAAMAAAGVASRDARRFPGHGEVRAYLAAYAAHHGLLDGALVRFGHRVARAAPVWPEAQAGSGSGGGGGGDAWPRWELTVEELPAAGTAAAAAAGRRTYAEAFDAVVVANGHYTATNVPSVPGADAFPGRVVMHSHNYRSPAPFAGERVLVVGASNSGEDLFREIAGVAAEVYVAARSWQNPAWAEPGGGGGSGGGGAPFGPRGNIRRRGMVTRLRGDGGAEFEWGEPAPRLDAVVFATGYRYDFPFLGGVVVGDGEGEEEEEEEGSVGLDPDKASPEDIAAGPLSTRGQRVAPLYGHIFPLNGGLAPSLSFVGLPWKVVPFPQFELQARLIARALSGAARLPSEADMRADAAAFYRRLRERGVATRHTHMQGDEQWAYNDWLVEKSGDGPGGRLPAWRALMYAATGRCKRAHPDDYRDRWDDAESLAAAAADLAAQEARVAAEAAARAGGDAAAGAASASAAIGA